MNKIINGKTTLLLSAPDQAGNVGYSLVFSYNYNEEDILKSFSYSDLKFSGPGSWEDYSCGDDYPVDQMMQQALSDQEQKQA